MSPSRASAPTSVMDRLRALLPSSDHPGASQPTPFGLSRYSLLLIYVFITLSTSCVYFGWGPLSIILFNSGAYLWLCNEDEQELAKAARQALLSRNALSSESTAAAEALDKPFCVAQDTNVQTLFTVCYATHFIVSGAAGVLIDTAGPKVTAILGQTLNLCGWFILGGFTDSFRGILPAFVLIGAGADMCFLPMLCISNVFPGSSGFILTVMGASCSLSSVVPMVLRTIQIRGFSFRAVCWGYALLGPAGCLVLVCLFVPLEGFIEEDRYVLVKSTETRCSSIQLPNRLSKKRSPQPPQAATAVAIRSMATARTEIEPGPSSQGAAATGVRNKDSPLEGDTDLLVATLSSRRASSLKRIALHFPELERSPVPSKNSGGSTAPERHASAVAALRQGPVAVSTVTDDDFFQPFVKDACTFLYVGVCIYFIICSVAMNYYQKAASKFLSPEAFSGLGAASPLSTFPCLIIGRVTDYVPIVPVMLFVNSTGVLCYVLALADGPIVGYASITFFSIYISVFTSQVYIFIKEVFTSVHYGKLIGIASMVGGLLSLTSNWLYNGLTMRHFGGDVVPVLWGMFAVICFAYLLLIPMFFGARKKQRLLKEQKVFLIPAECASSRLPPASAPAPVVCHQQELLSGRSLESSQAN
ncbi:major facilitator family protein [Cyclospora cayetanensis]|uniref:Major facilitator family protein n=1 Tax=Cyclospora cayetanensis TaxID=88456 RepID=A0A1D3CU53_9EIME|nr:major facilitator family protein [Cyclospora cayetanensis]